MLLSGQGGKRYRGFTQPFGVFMAADPDPDPFSDPFGVATREVRIHFRIRFGVATRDVRIRFRIRFGVATREVRIHFRIRFGVADRIRFRIRIRIRFQLKNRLTTAKVQRECCEELNMCMT